MLLSHLVKALWVPPAGRLATPQGLPGGGLFLSAPHAIATLERRFGHEPSGLLATARALGSQDHPGATDVAVQVPGLPMLPLCVLIWPGDEKFAARAVVGLDAHARHKLALDGIWNLTNLRWYGACWPPPARSETMSEGTGACGINCLVCGLFRKSECRPYAPGNHPQAQQKLATQLNLFSDICPILACAAERGIGHYSADCDQYSCPRYLVDPYHLSRGYLKMQIRRRGQSLPPTPAPTDKPPRRTEPDLTWQKPCRVLSCSPKPS